MKVKLTILSIFLFALSFSAFGQKIKPPKPSAGRGAAARPVIMPSVKEVLDKYVTALGGRTANEKIKSRTTKGTAEIMPGNLKGTFESYSAAPDKSYFKLTFSGIGDIIDSFDGKTAWTLNPLQGNHDKTGDELLQTRLLSDFYREINLDKLYSNMTVKSIEKVGENEAYVVTATPAGLDPETFYFDTKTGYLLRSDMTAVSPEGKAAVKTYYEDMREVDGVKIPYKARSIFPQFEIISITTEVKNNVPANDSLFFKPE